MTPTRQSVASNKPPTAIYIYIYIDTVASMITDTDYSPVITQASIGGNKNEATSDYLPPISRDWW